MPAVPERRLFVEPDEFTVQGEASLIGKLRGLQRDERAGFLPTTHNEKGQALELLDYESRHTGEGLIPQKRLQEIFKHQVKLYRKKHGENGRLSSEGLNDARASGARALASIALEWGDYLHNAQKSLGSLSEIARAVVECPNPRAPLIDEVGDSHSGFAPLVRYLDLAWIRDNEYPMDWGYDPMRTITDRFEPEDSPELRHKRLYDPYTAPEVEPVVADHIDHVASHLTIGDLRINADRAVINETNRFNFWLAREREVYAYHLAGRPAAKLVLEEAGLSVK